MKTTALNKTRLPQALIPTEDQECYLLVAYLERMKKQGKIRLFTHVANENNIRGGARVGARNKAKGVRKGFPDYIVITPNDIFFLEMKRTKGGVVSPEQQEWIDALNSLGLSAKVCRGYDEAKEFIESDFEGA